MPSSDTTPLVGSPKSPNAPTTAPRPLSAGAITALGAIRIATAAACMVAPQFTSRLFLVDVPPAASLAMRMVGAREAALGGLLLVGKNSGRRDALRMVLMAGIAADLLDIVAGVVDVASGSIGMGTLDMVAGGAVLAVALGVVGLRGL